MADILIRGMEIPQWCSACACNAMHYCQVLKRDVSEFLMTNKFPEDCPLVPLPEGHGRMIDADEPVRVVWNDGTIHSTTVSRLLCKHSLLDLPKTIVPAEGGNADG